MFVDSNRSWYYLTEESPSIYSPDIKVVMVTVTKNKANQTVVKQNIFSLECDAHLIVVNEVNSNYRHDKKRR